MYNKPNPETQVGVSGIITTTNPLDDFAVTHPFYAAGGFKYVDTIAERDSIPMSRRIPFITYVYVLADGHYYQLKTDVNNTGWIDLGTEIIGGSGSAATSTAAGVVPAFGTTNQGASLVINSANQLEYKITTTSMIFVELPGGTPAIDITNTLDTKEVGSPVIYSIGSNTMSLTTSDNSLYYIENGVRTQTTTYNALSGQLISIWRDAGNDKNIQLLNSGSGSSAVVTTPTEDGLMPAFGTTNQGSSLLLNFSNQLEYKIATTNIIFINFPVGVQDITSSLNNRVHWCPIIYASSSTNGISFTTTNNTLFEIVNGIQTQKTTIAIENGDIGAVYIDSLGNKYVLFLNPKQVTNYTTSEVDTDDKWVNSKTIYRKSLNDLSISNNNTNQATGINGVETIVKMHLTQKSASNIEKDITMNDGTIISSYTKDALGNITVKTNWTAEGAVTLNGFVEYTKL